MKCKYEHDDDCCNAGADQYMCKCKKPREFIWPLSNADHIRSMSDEELVKFLAEDANGCMRHTEVCEVNDTCNGCFRKWLKQPYGGE